MKKLIGITLIATSFAVTSTAFSADAVKWPTKPVQVIVPAGAGGDTDFNARTIARYFEKLTGKQMIITNVKSCRFHTS